MLETLSFGCLFFKVRVFSGILVCVDKTGVRLCLVEGIKVGLFLGRGFWVWR